jgi:hypothetical protein
MARSWVGRTIFACWPCMAMLRLREARHSYMNCENTEECYECAVVSRKMVDQIRSSPTLRHKAFLVYEWSAPPMARADGSAWYEVKKTLQRV